MKKLIIGAVMMLGFISFSSAQKVADTAKKAKKPATSTVKKAPATTTVAPTPAVKPTPPPPAKPAKTKDVVLKKDGTPDKRYKTVPNTLKGPKKKDGTLDKRYKSNKKT